MLEQYPEELRYSESNQWVQILEDGSTAIIGVTIYANKLLGEVLEVELPELGAKVRADQEIGLIESEQTSYDLYTPVSGKIIAVNEDLEEAPGLINSDPYNDGWICKIKLSDPEEVDELMASEEYEEFIANQEEED